MLTQAQINIRNKAIQVDVDAAYDDFVNHKITQQKFDSVMDAAEKESTKLKTAQQTIHKSMRFASGASPDEYDPRSEFTAKGVRCKNLSPFDIDPDELHHMYEAAKRKQPYRCEVTTKAFGAGSPNVRMKATGSPIAEGSPYPSGLLPPVNYPELTQELRYEFDRAADHLETIAIDAPSVEYLIHSGNVNKAAYVAELGVKSDVGMQLTTAIATPIKLAALASVSLEALSDFSYFQDWVPRELSRSLIDLETDELVSGTGATGALPGMTGLLNTSGVLTRAYNSSTDISGIDTLMEACNDVRTGPAYGKVDSIWLNPGTWDFLRRTKTTQNAFVLSIMDPSAIGSMDSLFGIPIVTNSYIPLGTGICLDASLAAKYFVRQSLTIDTNPWGDTQWTTNSISFRAEMRSVLAVVRPTAVSIVTGLDPTGAS
jgi:Phage capsid family